jgi:hypothetical protein
VHVTQAPERTRCSENLANFSWRDKRNSPRSLIEARCDRARTESELIVAILIKRDGSQQLVQPATGRVFSQEEIEMLTDRFPFPVSPGE